VTSGANEGILSVFMGFVDQGDEVSASLFGHSQEREEKSIHTKGDFFFFIGDCV